MENKKRLNIDPNLFIEIDKDKVELSRKRVKNIMKQNPRKILKVGSNGEEFLIDSPDFYDEDGNFRKYRNKMLHLTPKKKKRK
jgi:hypothetical protein